LVAALAVAATVAVPALATNEYFECSSCTSVNAYPPNNWLSNVQGINHSGGGSCSTVWADKSGGGYESKAFECAEGGGTETACAYAEYWGHGNVKTSAGNSFLRGRQDNFKSCE
jgi:hypothetical protein